MNYVCLGILLLLGQVFTFDDFVDCGGFIRPSKQLSSIMEDRSIKIDYSKDVKVHLLTLDGIKKFTAECSPNGYYIIPVYDKGTFVIKIEGPNGWVFRPGQVSVTIQGNGQCSQDFELIGFSIQGKVIGDSKCPSQKLRAPHGISISLTPLNSNVEFDKQTTLTDGTYRFTNTFPGEYDLEASHPEWTFLKKKINVVASWGNFQVMEDFVVSGYGITGRVLETSETGEPVKGVNFYLYSDDIQSLQCPKITENIPSNRKTPLCGSQTDESGTFYFRNIPCGKYTLVPYYKSTHTTYDVIPKEINVVIDQDTLMITTPFLVKGYSVVGRVVGANSEGIDGVLVKATTEHEERTATTDTNGEYTLDQIISGEYTITAEKLHHVFSTLTKYKISPNIAQLTDIVASRYHVCGRVFIPHPPAGVSIEKRKVSLDPLDKSTPPLTSRTDQTGAFCIPALPGKYTIFPEIKPEEIEAGLQLTETLLEVVVDSLPVLDVNFEQARLTVSGRVRCIETPCDTSLSVSLNAIGRASRVTTGLAIGHDDSSGEDHFIFKGVLPGKYEVTINHENWCWEKENEIIEVTIKDQNDIQFVQTGYVLVVKTSHDIDLLYTIDDKNEGKVFGLVKGKNTFCLPKPGVYRFTPSCCYRFELDPHASTPSSPPSSPHSSTTPSYVYDTTKPYVLKLHAQYYKVEGKIRLQNIPENPPTSKIQEDLSNIRINVSANEVNYVIFATKLDNNRYTLTYWAELGQKLVFTPVSSVLFFYPQSLSSSVEKSECQEELPPFDARPGMYLSGTITPHYPGVLISVHFEETDIPALPPITTTSTGIYHAGPLYDDRSYVVTASKFGYYLRPVPNQKGNFTALKLGSVLVRVTYQDAPLPGVLLSLSGGDGYKNNNATDSTGSFEFQDLFPGEYYLRPILKEYLFTPTSNSITIKEGEESKIEIISTRVAYSCFGKVVSLNGEPEKGVTVEAVGPNGLYEETQSDISGTYRLRGLFPENNYYIGVKFGAKNTKLSRAEPRQIPINITTNDAENVNFFVFRKTFKYDIVGVVIADQKVLPTLTVQLLTIEKNNYMKLISEVSVGPNYFFCFNSLDGTGEYIVKLKTELSKHSYHYTLPEEKVSNLGIKEVQPTKLVLKFHPTEQKFDTEVENGSFLPLIFLLIVMAIGYKYKIVIEFISNGINRYKQERVVDDYSSGWQKKKK